MNVETYLCEQHRFNFEKFSILVTSSSELLEVRIEDSIKTILEGEQAREFLHDLIDDNQGKLEFVKIAKSILIDYDWDNKL